MYGFPLLRSAEDIENHFPNIYKTCTRQAISRACAVVPAQHSLYGQHPCEPPFQNNHGHLYAIGEETSCNGVRQKQTDKQPSGKPCFHRKSSHNTLQERRLE